MVVLHIKNMVCDRCGMIVRQQLEGLGFSVSEVGLGQAEIAPEPNAEQMQLIATALKVPGFELIDRDSDKTVEAIKNTIIELVHHSDLPAMHMTFSAFISDRLNRDYAYLT